MAEESNQPTELVELGEFGLIKHLTSSIKLQNKSSIVGVGDDAAVIRNGKSDTLVSTDSLVEGVHFDLLYTPLKHLGYKSVIVAISDIYAMNGKPQQITVSIAASNRISVEALEELYEGMLLACKLYEVDLVGGDTCASTAGLVITITALGSIAEGKAVGRDGAKENDLICLTGDVGGAFMGLQMLEREKAVYNENPNIQPNLEGFDYILERQLKPEARKDVIEYLAKEKITPTSMIDVSDGVSSELLHICERSKCGCSIYEDKLPIDPVTVKASDEFGIVPSMCALNGGEDYELLFTVSQEHYDKLKELPWLSIIGHITDSGALLVTNDEKVIELEAQGWNAFGTEEE